MHPTSTPFLRLSRAILPIALCAAAACGSQKKSAPTASTPAGTTTQIGSGTSTSPSQTNSSSTATLVPAKQSDVPTDSAAPVLTPTSNVVATLTNGNTITFTYALLTANPNASDPTKVYNLALLDYDPCQFGYYYGYATFPRREFNFAGVFPEGTAGAAPGPGTYQVGGSMALSPNSGFGYGIANCTAAEYGKFNASGSVTFTTLDPNNKAAAGTMNLESADGTLSLTGSFTAGRCSGGGITPPTPPTSDPNFCTTIH